MAAGRLEARPSDRFGALEPELAESSDEAQAQFGWARPEPAG
ncbi:MAG: hypothetical protein ACR2KH_06610 [Sphingomicrobium sp.]